VLRAFLIYLSRAGWARKLVTGWGIAQRTAQRFVAGDTLEEAIQTIKFLNQQGLYVTLDRLGENVSTHAEAIAATEAYEQILTQIQHNKVKSSVSVKLTQLGLALDASLCLTNIRTIALRAAQSGNFVRIDMEDSPVIDQTISIYHALLDAGIKNVGLVIQSYLYRSEDDLRELLSSRTRIRLVKGAYQEPSHIAYPLKKDADTNFDNLTRMMIDSALAHGSQESAEDGLLPPITALGTHDEKRIRRACEYAEKVYLPRQALEIQMLYGIRNELQRELAAEGYPIRVYVPFGTQWYPYFVRRLAERPANLWFFISNFFRR
jgi:proline dehydrogenase